MISGQNAHSRGIFLRLQTAAVLLLALCGTQPLYAQFGFGFGVRGGVVGGVSIDADGTVRSATALEQQGWLKGMRNDAPQGSVDQHLAAKTDLRMVSLRKLQEAIAVSIQKGEPLSEEILYLAGLQRIEYIFVYPEQQDIVLAGPAEGWKLRDDASVVGQESGLPVMQLEDLLVALRSAGSTRKQPMSVSIDPTPEGQLRLEKLLNQMKARPGINPIAMESAMQEAFGPQVVSLNAVARDSRMASTLVAADYRMKRLAMNLEESPVRGLPSYMDMIRNGGGSAGTQPRWWMAPNYDAILHSEDMLAWKLTGQGIKAMTEEEIVDVQSGARTQTGRANKAAQKWANLFTAKFNELCTYNAAFGDLRNVMDLNIVATVIEAHNLEDLAGCDLALMRGTTGELKTPSWKAPKSIDPHCSFVKGRTGWTVSASGGVELNPWKVVAQQSKGTAEVAVMRNQAAGHSDHWWWN